MPDTHQTDKNYMLACYTASLSNSETLLCKSIRTSTIKKYLEAITELFVKANFQDPQKNLYGEKSPYVEAILKEHLRWETVPNRREPLTYKMVDCAYNDVLTTMVERTDYVPDNICESLTDWLILGMQAGMRLSEWCQDKSLYLKNKQIALNIDGSSKAFILKDFYFADENNRRRNNSVAVHIATAETLTITWRFQKNNDNGQKLTFSKNDEIHNRCPVRAALRIRARALRYNIPVDAPLAIYREPSGKICLIDNTHVEHFLQSLATVVYNISDKNELKKFTSHSIRVGACVVLHENNCSGAFIKLRLRWRSDAFLVYLRNTTKLAQLHNDATNNAT